MERLSMENQKALSVFTNGEFGDVRTLVLDEDVWFSGEDIVTVLGYDTTKNSYSKYIKRHCDEEDYLVFKKRDLDLFGFNGAGRKGEYLINESAIYSLVFGSPLESAKKFKRWITSEVLPSIRKHGAYISADENMTTEQLVERVLTVAQNIIDQVNC